MPTKTIYIILDDIRIALYCSFLFVIFVGFLLTKYSTEVLTINPSILYWWFGESDVCIMFDFFPSTFVLPFLWTFTLILWMVMLFMLYVRQTEAYLAKTIGTFLYYSMNVSLLLEGLCAMFFSTIFAVNPDVKELLEDSAASLVVHTIPFICLIFGLSLLAIVNGIYDVTTGWPRFSKTKYARAWWWILVLYPILLLPLSIIKVSFIINALSKGPTPKLPFRYFGGNVTDVYPCLGNNWPDDPTCGGLSWCSNCENFAPYNNFVDKFWTVMVLIPPLLFNIYCVIFHRKKIYGVRFTIEPQYNYGGEEDDSMNYHLSASD